MKKKQPAIRLITDQYVDKRFYLNPNNIIVDNTEIVSNSILFWGHQSEWRILIELILTQVIFNHTFTGKKITVGLFINFCNLQELIKFPINYNRLFIIRLINVW